MLQKIEAQRVCKIFRFGIVFELLLKLPYKTIKKSVVRLNHAFLFFCNENYFITSPSFLKKSMRRLQSASALAKSSSALAGLVLVKLA